MPAQTPVLSRQEQMLYGRLVRAFPGRIILARVALSRLLMVDDAAAPGVNRFGPLLADFVVCSADFAALAVLELVPSVPTVGSPQCAVDADGARLKDRLLNAAGVKVIRVRADDLPNEDGLRALVATLPLRPSLEEPMRQVS